MQRSNRRFHDRGQRHRGTNVQKSECLFDRRIVKTPKRWDRIVELAAQSGVHLPVDPDSKALSDFMTERKAADPDHFADLSLAIIKLMGPGEYVLERPGDPEQGHFGWQCRITRIPLHRTVDLPIS